jgi:malic enzyme
MRTAQTQRTEDKHSSCHRSYRGKIETIAKCPMASYDDLATWYTPGAAVPAQAIAGTRISLTSEAHQQEPASATRSGAQMYALPSPRRDPM